MRNPLHKLFRKIVFWVGDVRRLHAFPWVTWDTKQHRIGLDEVIRCALPKLEAGDIILHRDEGFLSNLFIGGCFIHAGVYVGDGYLVEAISEGVVKRHAAYILHSDYAIILRPNLDKDAKEEAVMWANKCVKSKYDELFVFNAAEERNLLKLGRPIKLACTEVPFVCYFDHVERLRITRRRNINLLTRLLSWLGLNTGTQVVDADMYVKADCEVVWKSSEVSKKWAAQMGADEALIAKL